MWIDHGEPERGARLLEEVERRPACAIGWYAAGEFARAAEARSSDFDPNLGPVEGLRFDAGVELLAGRLEPAAQHARGLARALRDHPADNDRLRRWYAARAETADCLADALDARRGDAEGQRRLRRRRGPITPGCAVLLLDSLQGRERIQAMHDLPAIWADVHDVPRAWLRLLAAEADPYGTEETDLPFESAAEVLAIPNGEPLARMLPGVERHLVEVLAKEVDRRGAACQEANRRRPGSPCDSVSPQWTETRAAASAAMFALLAGDRAGAQALVRAAYDAFEPFARARLGDLAPPPYEVEAVTALPDPQPAAQVVSLVKGEFLHGLLDVVADRDAGAIVRALQRRPPPDEDEKQAWAFAAAGDGVGLARWLRRPISQPGTFLRLGAPLLRSGRDDVIRWVRWGYRPVEAFRPTEEVVHLASLTAAAEALGPPAAAEPLRERTRRFREAILRRDTAVILAVLERL
jgi:hypothetical protein